jgi:CRISPR-associated protein Cas5d
MRIKFWAEYGLFTRPEYKAEPHTYQVLTPTAAVGLLQSIFWKPEIIYTVRRITVLNPIRVMSMQRNMIQSKQSPKVARNWMQNSGVGRYFADRDRAQRNHVILKNPAYIVDFHFELEPHATDPPDKYSAQFKRRVDRGQCYRQPYFGCREYPAFFCWSDGTETPDSELQGTVDLGMMPKQLHFIRDSKGKISWRDPATRQFVKGRVLPELFHAQMVDGVIEVV